MQQQSTSVPPQSQPKHDVFGPEGLTIEDVEVDAEGRALSTGCGATVEAVIAELIVSG